MTRTIKATMISISLGLSLNTSIQADGLSLDDSIHTILKQQKIVTQSDEIIVCVMDTQSGKILTINSSEDSPIQKKNIANHTFEPGTLMSPILIALLLENNLLKENDTVLSHNGTINYARYKITDTNFDKSKKFLDIAYTITHSSNIGITQFAHKLSPLKFYNGLQNFGLGLDIDTNISKIQISNGRNIKTPFIQLLRAYNVFNKNGTILIPNQKPKQIISRQNIQSIKNLLIKNVQIGKAKKTDIKGLEIGGMSTITNIDTSSYGSKKYIGSFFGFVNDKTHKYTIGVAVFNSKRKWPYYFASETAVPIFKEVVDEMSRSGLLKYGIKMRLSNL